MRRPGTPARRSYDLEVAFETQVRRAPAAARGDVLAWLRRWRRRPERVFWVMDGAGRWKRV